MELKLEAQSFNQAPTRSQVANSLEAIAQYLDRMAAHIILGGEFTAADAHIIHLLNGSAHIRGAQAVFDGRMQQQQQSSQRGGGALAGANLASFPGRELMR